jgi:hypothetical protein
MKRMMNARSGIAGLSLLALLGLVFLPIGTHAVADEYEWDSRYGYHEEEWYDPSDWFDPEGTGVEYESDYYGDYIEGNFNPHDDDDDFGDNYVDDDYVDVGYEDDYGYDDSYEDRWYGDNYYTNDWYDDETPFDAWYDDNR